jgi:hypothetical protein
MAWLTELRRQGHRQCHGTPTDGEHVCALMLLATMMGMADGDLHDVAQRAGLTREQANIVIMLCDGRRFFLFQQLPKHYEHRKHTFAEIADVVEGWFR